LLLGVAHSAESPPNPRMRGHTLQGDSGCKATEWHGKPDISPRIGLYPPVKPAGHYGSQSEESRGLAPGAATAVR
jgi:hypothetical protein